jgi:hypothetical protein
MKHVTFSLFGLLISGLIFFVGCDKNDSLIEDSISEEMTYADNANLKATFVQTPDLNQVEIEMIQYMKEEEKLARDVYYALYDVWGSQVFSNIEASEENHLAAVLRLIDFYSLPDSAVGGFGEFESEFFNNLYTELVDMGSGSLIGAYQVGVLIEEMDIEDLESHLEETTNENIILVFSNLLQGSRNHLRAFNNNLTKLGVSYVPQYLSLEKFAAIANSPMESGNAYQKYQGMRNGYGPGDGICDSLGDGSGNGPGDGDGVCDSLGSGSGSGHGDGDGVCDSLGDGNQYGKGHKKG